MSAAAGARPAGAEPVGAGAERVAEQPPRFAGPGRPTTTSSARRGTRRRSGAGTAPGRRRRRSHRNSRQPRRDAARASSVRPTRTDDSRAGSPCGARSGAVACTARTCPTRGLADKPSYAVPPSITADVATSPPRPAQRVRPRAAECAAPSAPSGRAGRGGRAAVAAATAPRTGRAARTSARRRSVPRGARREEPDATSRRRHRSEVFVLGDELDPGEGARGPAPRASSPQR